MWCRATCLPSLSLFPRVARTKRWSAESPSRAPPRDSSWRCGITPSHLDTRISSRTCSLARRRLTWHSSWVQLLDVSRWSRFLLFPRAAAFRQNPQWQHGFSDPRDAAEFFFLVRGECPDPRLGCGAAVDPNPQSDRPGLDGGSGRQCGAGCVPPQGAFGAAGPLG